ncbi:MAG TPA: Clp protease N-terminal domain-containing protein, partial [Chloroflexota bacterium]
AKGQAPRLTSHVPAQTVNGEAYSEPMETPPAPESEDTCSFCGRSRSQVRLLVEGAMGAFICDDCVWRLFRDHMSPEARSPLPPSIPSPGHHPGSMAGESDVSGNFDRFTERARKVLTLAQEEAQRFNHNYIGTEHLLLGLVREGEGVAAKVLFNLGIELTKVRSAVDFIIGRGERQVMGEIGLTPRAKKVIELSIDEARRLGHHYVGTEHLLLGLIREGEGIASGVLESLGVNLEMVRSEVIKVLTQSGNNPRHGARREFSGGLPAGFRHSDPGTHVDRFTDQARKVLMLAQEEAQRFNHNYIGTEHILLGLVSEGEGVAAKVLSNLGVELASVRSEVEHIIGRGERRVTGEIGLTPRAKKVIELAIDEGRRLGHHYVGTEHLLLGLIREGEGVAAGVLETLGVTLEQGRSEVIRVLTQPGDPQSEPS